MALLRIRYELPASNYFLDNGDLTRDLMIAIEGLTFTEGVPDKGKRIQVASGEYLWTYLAHQGFLIKIGRQQPPPRLPQKAYLYPHLFTPERVVFLMRQRGAERPDYITTPSVVMRICG